MSDEQLVLSALKELPFPVGKRLLADILIGEANNESIQRNKLQKLESFGILSYTQQEANALINGMIATGALRYESLENKSFLKVITAGTKVENPYKKSEITPEDKELFKQFDFFLNKYDEEQKKAIISPKKHILCIAGAGSGKTTTLVKRIEFLTQFRGILPEKVLAITFTRKAKEEMEKRLGTLPIQIETFNSFCERQLRKYNNLAYDKPVSVITFSEKIHLVQQALKQENTTFDEATTAYFSKTQLRQKTPERLRLSFVNECFSILDLFKNANAPLEDFTKDCEDKTTAKLVYNICKFLEAKMKELGKRDFTDQLIDAVNLFQNHPNTIPKYDHILIDEYQDINAIQALLIDVLNPNNLFCVGDPRQSIYGWRGSRIRHIMSFQEKYTDGEVITLTTNYRSCKHIVETANQLITSLNLPNLNAKNEYASIRELKEFGKESDEQQYILEQATQNNDLFIVARTNKTLNKLSELLKSRSIAHTIRSEEGENNIGLTPTLTLATVHAVKGLEAEHVIIAQCNSANFPCKASDHPIIDAIRFEDYDRQAEELRLLYVALTRAKKRLTITYVGNLSPFLSTSIQKQFSLQIPKKDTYTQLKDWRNNLAEQQKIPPYFIMHDATLQAIASQKPSSLFELEQIGGLGPVKLQKYGNTLLDIVTGLQ